MQAGRTGMGNKKTHAGPVLVTGGSGFIGAHLVSAFAGGFETYYTFLSRPVRDLAGAEGVQVDVVDGSAIAKLIDAIHPRVILHAAALPDFNRCASNPNEARKVNVEGSENVAQCAARVSARLVLLSTDLVFPGTSSFYTEYDTPAPCCAYGTTKLAAERAASRACENLLIARLSLTYGRNLTGSKSHVEGVAERLREGQQVLLFDDEYRTPIYVGDVAEVLLELAFRDDARGVLHLGGPQRVSRYELGTVIARLLSSPEDLVVPISSDNGGFLEPRPKDCSLRSVRLSAWWRASMVSPVVGLSAMFRGGNPLERGS